MDTTLIYAVREMSVDLLLLEEFYSSKEFHRWFFHKMYGENRQPGNLLRIEHSSIELEREADLSLAFEEKNGEFRILIENKINANFQKGQAKDYKKRALRYLEQGECAECVTVLIAPARYISTARINHLFDFYISYEEIVDFFKTQTHLQRRSSYKIDVLEKAIYKSNGVKGKHHQTGGDPFITKFWGDFWTDISVNVPQLVMERPGAKGPAATFIFFRNTLPKGVNLIYKFIHGFVDIQAEGKGEMVDHILDVYQDSVILPISIQKSGKSAIFRIQVPKVSPQLDYKENEAVVKEAQRALIFLYNWFNEHADLWKRL